MLRMKRTESGSSGARDPKASAESTKELLSAEFSELCWIQQQSLKASAHQELSWTTYFETLLPQTEFQVTIRKLNGTRDLYLAKIDHFERFWTHSYCQSSLGRRSAPSNFPAEMCIKSKWKSLVISFQSINCWALKQVPLRNWFRFKLAKQHHQWIFSSEACAEWYTDIHRSGAIK